MPFGVSTVRLTAELAARSLAPGKYSASQDLGIRGQCWGLACTGRRT
jgi:hypothetical protein